MLNKRYIKSIKRDIFGLVSFPVFFSVVYWKGKIRSGLNVILLF